MRWLDRAVEGALGLLAATLIVTAFGQVVARYVFARPFSWVLELDVLLLVWATMLCGYVGVRRNAHMAMDVWVSRWRAPARRRMAIAGTLASMAFVALFGWHSFAVIDAMEGISFTSIPLGQQALYWALPVGAGLMLLALGVALAGELAKR